MCSEFESRPHINHHLIIRTGKKTGVTRIRNALHHILCKLENWNELEAYAHLHNTDLQNGLPRYYHVYFGGIKLENHFQPPNFYNVLLLYFRAVKNTFYAHTIVAVSYTHLTLPTIYSV